MGNAGACEIGCLPALLVGWSCVKQAVHLGRSLVGLMRLTSPRTRQGGSCLLCWMAIMLHTNDKGNMCVLQFLLSINYQNAPPFCCLQQPAAGSCPQWVPPPLLQLSGLA
eukprot:scaffold17138_cov16-Tisochrysis_lutea.AAC.1